MKLKSFSIESPSNHNLKGHKGIVKLIHMNQAL